MNGKIPVNRKWRVAVVGVMAVTAVAMTAAAANAAGKVVYSDLNTVPAIVNGHPNQDTYSAAPFEFPFGGIVEFSHRPGVIKSMIAQVDSFTCEHGVYQLENCFTPHLGKKFHYQLTASVYEVGAGNKLGTLVASSTETFKIPYRPSTNVGCPATPEGKGFGANCDVGGYLTTVNFKHFSPAAVLPEKAIVMFTDTESDNPNDVVNIGMQTSYKEWDGEFVPDPPLEGGVASVGAIPFPEDAYVRGELQEAGWAGYQPVFQVLAKP